MRAIWKGAVSFGLVNVPVRVFAATQEHDIRFHQVHRADGGRIKMKRVCQACGDEVPWDQLAKGYESPDGRQVMLEDEDFASLPLTSSREIDVLEFVPADQVDPMLFDKSYYLEPEARTIKPYVLLREALVKTDRMAVVKLAMRQRETLAVLRVRDDVIVLQTMLWPDEIRAAEFEVLHEDVEVRDAELSMAMSLVESLAADFEPDAYEDAYAKAVVELVESKLEGTPLPEVTHEEAGSAEVVDLLTALQRSVEAAKKARGESDEGAEAPAAKKAPAKKTAAKKAPRKTA
ncbi:MAG: Ku protein [Kineosporiaceae bacterium]|nr:Ku protein [Kineosporiaceae bacterium]